jgi:hypothetical protein
MEERWKFAMLVGALLLYTLLVCIPASGESATDASVPHYSSSLWPMIATRPVAIPLPDRARPRLFDDALYASLAGYRTLDYFSTRRALSRGAHEIVLPQFVVENRGTFIAFEGIATASEVGGSMWLIRHGHRRVARAMNAVSIGLGVQAVVHNYTEPLLPAQ